MDMKKTKKIGIYCSLQEFREDFLSEESLDLLDRMNRSESSRSAPKLSVDVRAIILKGLKP